ncbi:MAG: ABC transporter ATP-binding protein [Prevotellaceae bacterium]|jgi:ABC-type multidrug transport system ATPase subunit|nr:ABC transporter ATP-binding protein [Prevotellaceae bacterium]
MNDIIVKCLSVNKSYKDVKALININLEVKKGELFGLIGADGAGKTTLFRILTSLVLADSGNAFVNNLDVARDYKKLRNQIGYMPGRFSLYQDLTVEENLNFFATVFNTTVKENYHLIEDIYKQIEPFKNRRAGKLSGGMKQKLALSCALIHKPLVLFLDEPTTGIDPVSRKELWEMLRNLKQQGITILVSTPYMDEASLCDRIALIQHGKILSVETPQNIKKNYPKKLYRIEASDNFALLGLLRNNSAVNSCFMFGGYLHVTFNEELKTENGELKIADNNNSQFSILNSQLKEIEPSVEDCFIELMTK